MVNFIIRDEEGIRKFDKCTLISEEDFSSLSKIKINILLELDKRPMYISELSEKLKLNEQNIYYHIKQLMPYLEVVDEKKIRGTTARKFKPKTMNFCLSLSKKYKDISLMDLELNKGNMKSHSFFFPFISDGKFNAKIIVGSPDPHGKYKARARDGHYATDLALYLGSFCSQTNQFAVALDTDVNLESEDNLVIVGGPVTNLLMNRINDALPVKFVEEGHWAIKGKKDTYTDDNIGLIARIPNPINEGMILVVAGLRFSGTKSAVIALTRQTKLLLNHFSSQNNFYAIVQGFDLDADGKIDNIELLESM